MRTVGGRALAQLSAAVVMLAIAACGDDEDGRGNAQAGGSITIALSSQPDFLDPALSYTLMGLEPMWLVYTPLVTYRRAEGEEGTELIPGLAGDLPAVSSDGKTYELELREGLRYSDGTAVKASDFEHTIKRVLNLESAGAGFFLVIEGAQEYLEKGTAGGDISGIETDDETGAITIRLTQPDSTFSNVLAMNFAGVVPSDTPFENQTQSPPPGVGPYKFTKSVPNREFVLERNTRFDIPDIPKGNVDTITVEIVQSQQRQARGVISGEFDYMQDPPPADLKPEIKAKYSDRYEEHPTVSTFYFFLNVRLPPFDDPKVREAVNYGIDKPALARLYAGTLQPGCSFLAPGMPGFDKALDVADCPWGNPSEPPDLEKARALIEEAGHEGSEVTVWGNNEDPTSQVTEAFADMLNKMGLKATPRIVDTAVYFQTVGSAETKAQTGFANWQQDFPHPKNFMFLIDGRSIQPTNNQNIGNVDDAEITQGIAELSTEPELTDEVVDRWRDLNTKVVERAWIVPYGHGKLATFLSERMDFENCSRFHPVYSNDYSSFCLK